VLNNLHIEIDFSCFVQVLKIQ